MGSVDSETGPVPTALYAFTRKMWATPSASSVTVRDMYWQVQPSTPVLFGHTIQLAPLSVEYSIV